MTVEDVFTHIVVGTDGSDGAESAVRQGVRLASITAAPLVILFVIDTGRPHDKDVEPLAEAVLAKAKARADEAGVEADARIVAGDPATSLIAEVDEKRADLLCVGPDAGLTTRPPRIGRVASRALREASCSVLVARQLGAHFPSRIVCGVDGSADSADLAGFALAIAAAAQAEIRLVHVIPAFQSQARGRTLIEGLASPELERAMRAAGVRGVVQTHQVTRGSPERRLVKVTKRDGSDLLVVGHRGVSGVHRMLLGSVSEYCASNASCSVLVSRPTEAH